VLDVGTGGLGDPQPVEREQRDQRMLEWRPEPGRHQQGSHLVAVKSGGMGLVIQPAPPDMRGRGMIQKFLFDGVLVEPGDGGQPPGDGRVSAAPGFQLPGEALDVGPADREQGQGAGAAPGGELAQVQRVRLAGQPAVSGQNPARASRSASVKAGWIVARAVDGAAVVIGHLPAGLRPGRLGQLRVPAIELSGNPT